MFFNLYAVLPKLSAFYPKAQLIHGQSQIHGQGQTDNGPERQRTHCYCSRDKIVVTIKLTNDSFSFQLENEC